MFNQKEIHIEGGVGGYKLQNLRSYRQSGQSGEAKTGRTSLHLPEIELFTLEETSKVIIVIVYIRHEPSPEPHFLGFLGCRKDIIQQTSHSGNFSNG